MVPPNAERRQRSPEEIKRLVDQFEDCTLDPATFKHRDHLTVALWYEANNQTAGASMKFRETLLKFVDHYQIKAYNETITLFWIYLVHDYYGSRPSGKSIPELTENLIADYGDSKLIFDYYSKDHLMSDKGKNEWVEPDLKDLGFEVSQPEITI